MLLQPLAGDAGFRRYFRLAGQTSLIAVDSPPDKENNPAYINVAMAFQRHGVTTPKIIAVDFARGFFLLEDFGHQLLHPELLAGRLAEDNSPARLSAANYYQQAESVLLDIQAVQPKLDLPESVLCPHCNLSFVQQAEDAVDSSNNT